MMRQKLAKKLKKLYSQILANKLITICVLFTFFTLLDTAGIMLGFWTPKSAFEIYTQQIGRFVLYSISVGALVIFDLLRKRFKSNILIYFITFFLSWGIFLIYLWFNNFFTPLHSDEIFGALLDISLNFIFVYLFLGIVIFIFNKSKKKMTGE